MGAGYDWRPLALLDGAAWRADTQRELDWAAEDGQSKDCYRL